MDIVLYEYGKKLNSTVQPKDGVNYNGSIKENSSIYKPIVTFKLENAPTFYNMAYIPIYSRYYFINNWTYTMEGYWVAEMETDTLATWKNAIGGSIQFVTRAENDKNGKLTDNVYLPAIPNPIQKIFNYNTGELRDLFARNTEEGNFVIGVINKNTSLSTGMVTYYAMTNTSFSSLGGKLFSDLDWANLEDTISINYEKTQINPLQYVVSCVWIPFNIAFETYGTITDTVYFGYWDVNVPSVCRLSKQYIDINVPINIKRTDIGADIENYGEYLLRTPYTRYFLFYPYMGQIEINGIGELLSNKYEEIAVGLLNRIDLATGQGALRISLFSKVVARYTGNFGVNVKLGMTATDTMGIVNGFLQAIGGFATSMASAATGNVLGVMGGIGFSIHGVSSVVESMQPKGTSVGSAGSMAETWLTNPFILVEYCTPLPLALKTQGRLLMDNRTPASLKGFMIVDNPQLSLDAFPNEIEKIKNFMLGGFYYE